MVVYLACLHNYPLSLNLLWTQRLLKFRHSFIVFMKLPFFSLYSTVNSVIVVYVIWGKTYERLLGRI